MSKSRVTNFKFDRAAVLRIENSSAVNNLLHLKAIALNERALAIFVSRVKHTHPVTLPPYALSFKVRRAVAGVKQAWLAYNDDPAAFYVEFGAYMHDPNHPRILKYRPYRLALDAMASES